MKKLVLMSALVLGGLSVKTANAQLGIHVNLHLGGIHAYANIPVAAPAPPPAPVCDEPVSDDDYYYLPDVEAYYSVPENCYYYQDVNGMWISAAYLPGYYHDYNWRNVRHFEVRAQRPYLHHDVYRGRFGGWANRGDYYARAYPNRGPVMRDQPYAYDRHNDNHGWNNGPRDNGYGRRDDDNRGNWNGNRNNNYGGDNGSNRHDDNDNRGNWSGNRNNGQQNGYNQGGNNGQYNGGQPQNNNNNNQGGYNRGGNNGQYNNGGQQGQSDQNRGGQQPQGGQPANHNDGGHDRGNNNGGGQYTRNMGVVNGDRVQSVGMNSRPIRF